MFILVGNKSGMRNIHGINFFQADPSSSIYLFMISSFLSCLYFENQKLQKRLLKIARNLFYYTHSEIMNSLE